MELAEGIPDYMAAVRAGAQPGIVPAPEKGRLLSDLSAWRLAYPLPADMQVTTTFVVRPSGETPVRLYRPAGESPKPILVYFHGGAFAMGSIETFDPLAVALAEASDAIVISVHYARLPDATPKAIFEESYAVLLWAARLAEAMGGDPARIGVAGDSAGAYIATLMTAMARDQGGPALKCQALLYGVYDMDETRAYYATANDPNLTLTLVQNMIKTFKECDARDPSPLPPPLKLADVSGLPPALFVGAPEDPMLEEGREYADRLEKAGIAVDWRVVPGMPHGFFRAVRFSEPARAEMRRLGGEIKRYL
ncbi:MAG: alpha/beta hydrolase [Sphingobium sp.]